MRADPAEIARLHAAYAYTIDHQLLDDFVGLFAVDAVMCVRGDEPVTGSAALEEYARSAPRGVHLTGAATVDDNGLAHSPFIFVAAGSGSVMAGYYTDEFTRSTANVLQFRRRDIDITVWGNEWRRKRSSDPVVDE